jgi:protoporphyrinogen oxidase
VTVAVLGAGPAGLVAAWRAALAGHDVVVVEREAHVGGMAASLTVGGQRVDLGSHRLHPSTDPQVLAALRRLLGDELQWRPRHGRIRLEGRWVRFPLRPADLLRSLPPSFAAGVARDAATRSLRRERDDTFAEVVRARLGPTMLDRFYGPYAEKLWGLPADRLAGEHARRRIGARGVGTIAARAVRRRRPGFWYPAGGFGRIVEVLAAAGAGAGADLRLGEAVTAVEPGRVTTSAGVIDADHVWSTLPLGALARLAGVDAPPLPLRALVLVYLVLDVDRWTEWDAHYLPGRETPVSRVSEPKGYRDGPDPAGRTVLCAEVPCEVGDATWSATAEDLAGTVKSTLELPRVAEVAVRRLPAAYPVYRAGAAPLRVDVPGVVTFGRGGLFAHDNTHHAMAEGWAAADALAPDGSWDDAAWAVACDRFAGHVVED